MPRGQATAFRLGLEKRRADEVLEWRTFAAAHESAFGPTPTTWAVQQVVSCMGSSGHAADAVVTAAHDPLRKSEGGHLLCCTIGTGLVGFRPGIEFAGGRFFGASEKTLAAPPVGEPRFLSRVCVDRLICGWENQCWGLGLRGSIMGK